MTQRSGARYIVYTVSGSIILLLLFWTTLPAFLGILLSTLLVILVGSGFFRIPIAHVGVPLLFGRRLPGWVLSEGWAWLPPNPIMSAVPVSIQRQTLDIKVQQVITNPDRVSMTLDISILWEVDNAYQSLMFSDETDRGIEPALRELASRVAREAGLDYNSDDLAIAHKALSAKIQSEVDAVTEGRASSEIAGLPVRPWGINIDQAFVVRISFPKEIEDAFAKISVERRQRDAEAIERDHVVASVKKIATELEISELEASKIFQRERQKIESKEQIISAGGDLVDKIASAILDRVRIITARR